MVAGPPASLKREICTIQRLEHASWTHKEETTPKSNERGTVMVNLD